MSKITTIDRTACRVLREKMQAALGEFSQVVGMEFTVGNMSFTAHTINVKVEARLEGAEDSRVSDFKKYHSHFGLGENDLGRQFRYGTKFYEIVGININARKNPIIARDVRTNKEYVFNEDVVISNLSIPPIKLPLPRLGTRNGPPELEVA